MEATTEGTQSPGGRRPTRVQGLDPLRAVAALAILVGHGYALGGRGVPLSASSFTDSLLALTPTGVWMFFAISGFVIARPFIDALVNGSPMLGRRGYAFRRAFRIFPLYWACAAVVIVALDRLGTQPRDVFAHLTLLHNLVPGRQQAFINVAWTLSLEVLFYVAVPVLTALLARWSRGVVSAERLARLIVLSAGASVALLLACGLLAGSRPEASLYGRLSIVGMWSAFCPGLLAAVWWADRRPGPVTGVLGVVRRLTSGGPMWWAALVITAAVGYASTWTPADLPDVAFVLGIDVGRVCWSAAFGLVVLRIVAQPEPRPVPAPLAALGDWSYGIYLIHGTILLVLIERFSSWFPLAGSGLTAYLAHLGLLLGVTLPLAAASWHLLERPAIALGRRLGAGSLLLRPPAVAEKRVD